MSRENVEVVRRSMEAFRGGDWENAMTAFHPDVVWEETPSLGPDAATYRGINAVRDALQSWTSRWEDYSYSVSRYAEAGDDVVVLIKERGRGRASEATVQRETGEVHTFRDGKVVRTRLFGSWREALQAAGLSE